MSHLPYHRSFLDNVAAGWGPFTAFVAKEETKQAKHAAQFALQDKELTLRHEQEREREAREVAAMEGLRAQVLKNMAEIENTAVKAAAVMEKARQEVQDPVLQDDPFLVEFDAQAADMDQAVVQAQSQAVADVASFDSNALAVSYSDTKSALAIVRAVLARAQGLLASVQGRKEVLIRRQEEAVAAAAAAAQRRRESERQAEIDRKRAQADREAAQIRAAEAQRRRDLETLAALNAQIMRERLRLHDVRLRIVKAKARA